MEQEGERETERDPACSEVQNQAGQEVSRPDLQAGQPATEGGKKGTRRHSEFSRQPSVASGLAVSAAARSGGAGAGGPRDDATLVKKSLVNQFVKIKAQLEDAAAKHEALLKDLRRKDASYARREAAYKREIADLRERLEALVLPQTKDDKALTRIEVMHEQILTQVDKMDDSAKEAKEQRERDLLTHFRAKLAAVEPTAQEDAGSEIEAMPSEWLDKTSETAKELDKFQEQAARLGHLNNKLKLQNDNLVVTRQMEKAKKDMLVAQTIAIKRDNQRIQQEILRQENMAGSKEARVARPQVGPMVTVQLHRQHQSAALSRPMTSSSDASQGRESSLARQRLVTHKDLLRYREVESRLKSLLMHERRTRAALIDETHQLEQSSTPLQQALRESYDTIIKGYTQDPLQTVHGGRRAISSRHREEVLEHLLAQDRILHLLYDDL